MTLQQADLVVSYYSFLIGGTFKHSLRGRCDISRVEPYMLKNGTYTVVLVYDIYRPPCIPEFYEFKCPRKDLLTHLKENNIEFNAKRFGLD